MTKSPGFTGISGDFHFKYFPVDKPFSVVSIIIDARTSLLQPICFPVNG